MRDSTRIAINTVTNWSATAVAGIIGLLLVPFLISRLGREGYGLITLTTAIVGFTSIVDLGLRSSLSRHLAEQIARRDVRRFNEIASSAMAVYVVLGLVAAGACMAVAAPLAKAFQVSDHLLEQAVPLIRWYGGISIFLSFINPIYSATLIGLHRFDLLNMINASVGVVRGISILAVFTTFEPNLLGWAAVMVPLTICALTWTRMSAHRHWPSLAISPSDIRRDALKSLFSLGGYMFVIQLANYINVQADPFVLTAFLGPTVLALYAPALSVSSLVRPIILTLVDQLHPVATSYYVTGRQKDLQAVLVRGTRYTLLMGALSCTLLGAFAEPLMRFWLETSLGPEYRTVAQVLAFFALADLLTFASGTQWPIMVGMQRLGFIALTKIPQAGLNIGLSIYLVGYTDLGVLGVLIPTVVLRAILCLTFSIYAARLCGITARDYFHLSYTRPLLILVVLLAYALLLQQAVPPTTLMIVLVEAGTVAALWLPLSWWVGLPHADRQSFAALWARVRDRFLA